MVPRTFRLPAWSRPTALRAHPARCSFGIAGLGLLVTLALLTPGHAETVRIELDNAPPAEIRRQLQHLLGAPVEIRGGEGQRLTLLLATTSPTRILDRVATQLGGTWRMRLQVRAGRPDTPRPSPSVDHAMALGVQDVPAQRAFALIARELKAELDTQGDLSRRVSIIAANVPASVVLDRVADQAGVSWDVSYRLDVPNVPVPIVVMPQKRETSELPAAVPLPPPVPLAIPTGPTPEALRTELWAGIHRIVRAVPDQRAAVVQEFLQRGDVVLQGLSRLTPAEQAERRRLLGTLVTSWKRLHQGLAPGVRMELAPVTALLERLQF